VTTIIVATGTLANFSAKTELMAHVVRTVTTAWSPEQAFAYLADFTHAAEWDPGVVEATRVGGGDVGGGSAFDLTVVVGGRRRPMRYEVTDSAPGQVAFLSRSFGLESVDTMTVTNQGRPR
jgi:Polyketide cyclase / dehydrase and lipid transport